MSEKTLHLDEASFREQIVAGRQSALIDFWAPWCGPCRQLEPVLDELAEQYEDRVVIAKVDVDQHQHLAMQLGVQAVPTLVLMREGEVVDRIVGVRPRNVLVERIEALLVPASASA